MSRTGGVATVALALALALLAGAAGSGSASTGGPIAGAGDPIAKIEPALLDRLSSEGRATFWVVLADRADLAPASLFETRADRGRFVFDALRAVAERSQTNVRTLLDRRGAPYRAFWIANAVRTAGDVRLVVELAGRPEVARVVADRASPVPVPERGTRIRTTGGVEWNVDRTGAPRVWSELGTRGEGIVVANIDTGVQYDHPALVRQYRGRNADGTFSHDYNWFDPTGGCAGGTPCDDNGHGTHTMGTIVGDDGENRIGVAPGARWIAVKGCESSSCSSLALLGAGQWLLAPTDRSGRNPRPDLAPHVVNNSWGGAGGDPFYQDIVRAWVAAGIFPAFAVGNAGPRCGSAGSPGDYPQSYAVGASDPDDQIARFSSRGPALDGAVKPDVTAPGVNIRSSLPGGVYASWSGTSMATPHAAGAVVLLWSANAAIRGDIGSTAAALDATALDGAGFTCGGTADDNNTWGEGRLDGYAAIVNAPRTFGTLRGTVTDALLQPLPGATVTLTGAGDRTTTTAADSSYAIRIAAGTYAVTVSLPGYTSQTAGVVISADATVTSDFELAPEPTAPGPPGRAPGSGDLDASFGAGGKVRTDFGRGGRYANGAALQPDGKIVLAGFVGGYTEGDLGLVRYEANGRLDTSFGQGGTVVIDLLGWEEVLSGVAVQPDGKIVAAGYVIRTPGGTKDFLVIRLDADGALDTTFGVGGIVITNFFGYDDVAGAVAIQPDGKIVAAGWTIEARDGFADYNFALARYNPDGSLDPTFGAGGKAAPDLFGWIDLGRALVLQPDGKLVLAGIAIDFSRSGAGFDFALARYNADGTLDASFGAGGKTITDFTGGAEDAFALALQPDGKLVAGGHGGRLTTGWDFALARYNPNGSLDSTFGLAGSGRVMTDFGRYVDLLNALAVQRDGKIVAAGITCNRPPATYHYGDCYRGDFALARYTSQGALDRMFGLGGKTTTDFGGNNDWANALAIQPDGRILAAGSPSNASNSPGFGAARYLP